MTHPEPSIAPVAPGPVAFAAPLIPSPRSAVQAVSGQAVSGQAVAGEGAPRQWQPPVQGIANTRWHPVVQPRIPQQWSPAQRPTSAPPTSAPPSTSPVPRRPGAGRPAAKSRRSWLWPVLTALLVVSLVFAGGGAAAAGLSLRAGDPTGTTAWIDALRPSVRNPALTQLLERRAKTVLDKDKAGFMADVATTDPAFVKRQELLYDNLVKIPFAELRFELQQFRDVDRFLPAALRVRFHGAAVAAGVTIFHRIDGIDTAPIASPWVPLLGYAEGHWRFAGEATDKTLPFSASGQAWDVGEPITVLRSARVVAVLSADDADRGPYLLQLAERGLDRVAAVRPAGWAGKVFVTAVQDQRIFDRYFADSPDRIAQVAAIAVPFYDRVPEWNGQPIYATTRIVFNPSELSAQPEALAADLTHEFTHAAMGPVTTGYTPRWLVEGFAEFVSYRGMKFRADILKRSLVDLNISAGLPADSTFYNQPRNYAAGWMACRMIAERFGEPKLIALYEAYQTTADDSVVRTVLGVDLKTLEQQWRDYVEKQRK